MEILGRSRDGFRRLGREDYAGLAQKLMYEIEKDG